MNKLEAAAREYALSLFRIDKETGAPEVETRNTTPIAVSAFIDGAQWQSKQSPWISVEERLPSSDNDLYIALDTKMNPYGCDVCEFNPQRNLWTDSKGYAVYPTHWMPIPELSFDEILEANKDVLKRIKENGD